MSNCLLVLEDDEEEGGRIEWLKKRLAHHNLELRITKNMEEFLQILKDHNPPVVIMDHDLGFDLETAENRPTGYDVVKKMPDGTQIVVVWTENPIGGQNMYMTLKEKGYKVFVSPYSGVKHHLEKFLAEYYTQKNV